ncbi:hypothetical protein MSIM_10180 [Mycobacterium simiae]|nr:hypothetical protein MSIM_10180 [Mycobacterium simiae]
MPAVLRLPPRRELRQGQLGGPDPARRGTGQPVLVADEVHSGLADPIEYMVAAHLQRDKLYIQLISHDDPPPVPSTVS